MPTFKARIMVVEQDSQASAFMAEALYRQGCEVIVVRDSRRAIAIAESQVPHAFLLNLAMPQPDGFRLCKILRAHPNFKNTPILLITTLDATDSKIVAIGAGATNYLVKPFCTDELISRVQDLLP